MAEILLIWHQQLPLKPMKLGFASMPNFKC